MHPPHTRDAGWELSSDDKQDGLQFSKKNFKPQNSFHFSSVQFK